jgi:capsular exopolysaccharide synthesis family protein
VIETLAPAGTTSPPDRPGPGQPSAGGAGRPDPLLRESFRTLRSNLQLRRQQGERVFVVTSSRPQEGKSTIAASLACALASGGAHTLVIDADLRRPSLHRAFKLGAGPGLSEVLRHQAALHQALTLVPEGPTVLSAGGVPADPQPLLAAGFADVVAEVRDDFDFVIVDTAPLLAVADTTLVTPHADGVILVLRSGLVTAAEALTAKERLAAVRARIVGCVLSHFDGPQPAYHPYSSSYTR